MESQSTTTTTTTGISAQLEVDSIVHGLPCYFPWGEYPNLNIRHQLTALPGADGDLGEVPFPSHFGYWTTHRGLVQTDIRPFPMTPIAG